MQDTALIETNSKEARSINTLFSHKDFTSPFDIPTVVYKNPIDTTGLCRTMREALLTDFASNISQIVEIRTKPGITEERIKQLKNTMACFCPSAKLRSRAKGKQLIESYTGLLQIDSDDVEKYGFDIEELKAIIFELPYVFFVGKSVTGKGIFALIAIEEPEKLREYAEHCFAIFKYYGIPIDPSKGRNYSDLRFLSYDANMLIRVDPQPLKIKRFHKIAPVHKEKYKPLPSSEKNKQPLINWAVNTIQTAVKGNRWATVQKVSYSMGGVGVGLEEITEAINNSPEFTGCESKYIVCAQNCFNDGMKNPLSV